MKIIINCPDLPYQKEWVFAHFQADLFLALNPPIMPVKLLRFDGCLKSHQVHIQLGISPFSTVWVSHITDYQHTDSEIFFIDEGTQLPFPLKRWQHKHRIIQRSSSSCYVREEITYSCGNRVFDVLMFPFLHGQFLYRKWVYPRFLKRKLKG